MFKRFLTGSLIIGLSFSSLTAEANFGPEIRLTTVKGPSVFPRLAAANGMLHSTWTEFVYPGYEPEVYYARSPDNGITWTAPVNLSNAAGRNDALPLIAAAGSNVYVAWTTDPVSGEVYFRRSLDGGATWQSPQQISNSSNGYSRATDLWVDRFGNLHLGYYDSRNVGYGQVYHRMSCDGGQSWTPEQNVTQNDGIADSEYPRLGQLPSGNLYLVFRSTRAGRPQQGWPPFSLFGVRSVSLGCPGGANWLYPAQALSPLYPEEYAAIYSPTLLTTSDGRLAVAYWDRIRGTNVTFRRGAPENQGWEAPVALTVFSLNQPEADSNAEGLAPSLAEAPGLGLYAAFQQTTGAVEGFATGPILYTGSNDGVTWTAPSQVPTRADTMHPQMIFHKNKLHFAWADFRNAAEGSFGSEIYYRSFTVVSSVAATDLIRHYYQFILGRSPDSGGLTYWQGETTRMEGLGVDTQEAFRVMAGWFFTSAEYLAKNTDNNQYVIELYRTFFNREPDGGGLTYWSGQLAAGLPRSVILFSFMFSPEFGSYMKGLLGDTTSRGEVYAVVDFYRGFLNRLPDSSGFQYWLGRFRGAQCSGAAAVNAEVDTISRQFLASAEYTSRNRSNSDYVADLYYAFLRRGGDLSGFNHWVNQLNTGSQTREQVRMDFLRSPEFQSRVTQIINQGCLR